MDQFQAIESVRMSVKHAKRKKERGEKIYPGRARLGKKIDQLVVYTSLILDPSSMIVAQLVSPSVALPAELVLIPLNTL